MAVFYRITSAAAVITHSGFDCLPVVGACCLGLLWFIERCLSVRVRKVLLSSQKFFTDQIRQDLPHLMTFRFPSHNRGADVFGFLKDSSKEMQVRLLGSFMCIESIYKLQHKETQTILLFIHFIHHIFCQVHATGKGLTGSDRCVLGSPLFLPLSLPSQDRNVGSILYNYQASSIFKCVTQLRWVCGPSEFNGRFGFSFNGAEISFPLLSCLYLMSLSVRKRKRPSFEK